MTKSIRITLVLIFLFQVFISAGFELAHDEAYYWLYSRNLDWGFFDHPPFVGVVIKLFSFLPHSELAVRLGFIFLQFGSLLFLLKLTGTASITTTLLFFSFPLASFTGLLALPDIPLLFMTACYCFQLKKYLEKDTILNSSILGLVIAVLFYAKYHGVLLVFFTILSLPKLLLRKSFYVAALVAIAAFFPHMWWQYQHDFSTLRYHFIERPSSSFSFRRSLEFIGLQILLAGVFAGPVVWWIALKRKSEDQFTRAMKFISFGTVAFFLFSSFSKRVEANWTIFLAVPLIYLSSYSEIWKRRAPRLILLTSFVVVLVARILFVLPPETVKLKRLREFHGWEKWTHEVKAKCEDRAIIANSYQIASKLSYYLNAEIPALNYHSRKNQFDYWRFDQGLPTKEVCYVTDKKQFSGENFPTPEGKRMRLVKNLGLEELWQLKYNETR